MSVRAVVAVAAVLVAAVAAAGLWFGHNRNAVDASSGAGASGEQVLAYGGVDRRYLVHRPATLPANPPLVVVLHGGFGSGRQAEQAYGWDAVADREGFVVAYPDGIDRAWNTGGGCCGVPGRTGVDDIGFITAMVDRIARDDSVDRNRIFAAGMSNGGIMTYSLACGTDVFAAIGAVAATQLGECAQPRPISVIHVHGAADTRIPYGGGRGDGIAQIDGPAVPDLIARWRGIDGCAAPDSSGQPPVTISIARCPDDRAVELVTIEGAGHQWPGRAAARIGADTPSTAFDATSAIWQFFAAHPRPPR